MYPSRTVRMTGGKALYSALFFARPVNTARREAGIEIVERIRRNQALDNRPVRAVRTLYAAAAARIKRRAGNGLRREDIGFGNDGVKHIIVHPLFPSPAQ